MSKVLLTILIWLIIIYIIDSFRIKHKRRDIPFEWIIPALFISSMILSWILIPIYND